MTPLSHSDEGGGGGGRNPIPLLFFTMHDPELDFRAFQDAFLKESPDFFAPDIPVFIARAPGRLDVMGGIADYSGSLVAEMPIAQAAVCAAQRDASSGAVIVRTANADTEGLEAEVILPAEVFTNPVSLLRFLRERDMSVRWAGYVAGCVSLLRAEGLIPRGVGARFFLNSDVPLGAGVSSSAAVEVASMRAVCAAFNIPMTDLELARLCQRVENDVMDAPCGIMDQVTSVMGSAGELLLLLCQPHTVQGTIALPADWSVFGLDSRVKHSVRDDNYVGVRVAAFMGYKILSDRAKSGFGGYLANLTPTEYDRLTASETASRNDDGQRVSRPTRRYLRHGNSGTSQTVSIRFGRQPSTRSTKIFACIVLWTAYVREARPHFVRRAILFLTSHRSYSACGLGAPETDLLVELAYAQGETVAGAKITGAGSGGTVCILCKKADEERIAQAIITAYAEKTGITPRRIRGTSPGAIKTPIHSFPLASLPDK